MEISRKIYEEQRHPEFGCANPERMRVEFWEWMIRGDHTRTTFSPSDARRRLANVYICDDGPIWTFARMGATRTTLPDGRTICIGGEYDDFYDPDFNIYNDVIVLTPSGDVEIYGYPRDVFPPTDFHTATLIDDRLIIIVGGLRYSKDRLPAFTSVYALDTNYNYIYPIKTSGDAPSWLHHHEAELRSSDELFVRGGEVLRIVGSEKHFVQNCEDYLLNLSTGVWQCLTSRNWLEFSIRAVGRRDWIQMGRIKSRVLWPEGIDYVALESENSSYIRFTVSGIRCQSLAATGLWRSSLRASLRQTLLHCW